MTATGPFGSCDDPVTWVKFQPFEGFKIPESKDQYGVHWKAGAEVDAKRWRVGWGVRDALSPSGPKFLYFRAVFGGNRSNNR